VFHCRLSMTPTKRDTENNLIRRISRILRATAYQCRINANRGPWQLFARAPLLTRDKDLESIRHDGNYFVSLSIRPIIIFVAEVMSNYLTTDGLKKISLLPEAPFGLRPVAFATSATWLIRHCSLRTAIHTHFVPAEARSSWLSGVYWLGKRGGATSRKYFRGERCCSKCSWYQLSRERYYYTKWSEVYASVWRPSVCPSVCSSISTAANPLLQVCCCGRGRWETSIDCYTARAARRAAGECGQCHVVSVRRKLNRETRFLLYVLILILVHACYIICRPIVRRQTYGYPPIRWVVSSAHARDYFQRKETAVRLNAGHGVRGQVPRSNDKRINPIRPASEPASEWMDVFTIPQIRPSSSVTIDLQTAGGARNADSHPHV